MNLTPEDLAAIEQIVRGVLKPTPVVPEAQWLPRRLTVDEFAYIVETTPAVARRWLRANRHGIVRKKFAVNDGGRKWLVDIAALPLFGVTPALAAARLSEFHARATRPSTPAQPPQLSAA